MKTKPGRVTYWILTLLVVLPFLGSGIAYVVGAPPIVAGMQRLGFPPYITPFLGIAKVLAAVAIAFGVSPRLKEWAYAGLIFDTIGAIYSHVCANQMKEALNPAVILVVLVASYLNWRKRESALAV